MIGEEGNYLKNIKGIFYTLKRKSSYSFLQ